jgi:DNA-binding NarL/FixJ family response regulator
VDGQREALSAVGSDAQPAMTEPGVTDPLATGPVAREAIRVLVADDHALYRRGLEMVLSAEPDIEIVGEAGDGAEAIARAEELLPDVVLMDIRMPRRSGIEACSTIKEVVPSTKIVILTISDEESDLFQAVRAGANGYLLKDVPGEEIADGIRAVVGGQSLISPSMASALLTEFAALSRVSEARPQLPAPRLTDRELQVLRLVARGMANRDIAGELFISENTVKNHVRNILEKLQLHSRMEAVVYAVREKILDIS